MAAPAAFAVPRSVSSAPSVTVVGVMPSALAVRVVPSLLLPGVPLAGVVAPLVAVGLGGALPDFALLPGWGALLAPGATAAVTLPAEG